jgi:hypothetical protein
LLYEFEQLCVWADVFERVFDGILGVAALPLFGPGKQPIDGIVQLETDFVHPLAGGELNPPCNPQDNYGPGCGRVSIVLPRIGLFPGPAVRPGSDVWRVEQPMQVEGGGDSRFPLIFHKRVVKRLRANGAKFGFHPLSPLVEEIS